MGFNDKIKRILKKEEPKKYQKSCENFWCKVRYEVNEEQVEDYPEFYSTCPKCRSYANEMSGGVVNNGQRNYEGVRFDNETHEVIIREHNVGFKKN